MGLTVREAISDDHGAVARLTIDVYVGEDFSPPEAAASLGNISHRSKQGQVLVAVNEDGKIVGALSLLLDGGPLAQISKDDEAEIRMLAVDPSERRAGAGRALTEECIARARSAGKRRIVLSTQPTMLGAQRLYEGLGFRREPARDWARKNGRPMLAYGLDVR
jgi:ribosomal protein S18 acetylase RimI-like enzyme